MNTQYTPKYKKTDIVFYPASEAGSKHPTKNKNRDITIAMTLVHAPVV